MEYSDLERSDGMNGCASVKAEAGGSANNIVIQFPMEALSAIKDGAKWLSIVALSLFLVCICSVAYISVACTRMMDAAEYQDRETAQVKYLLSQDTYWKQRVSVRLEYFGVYPLDSKSVQQKRK